MKRTNVIIVGICGIIEAPIVCNCSTRAGLIYAKKAKKLGVKLSKADIKNMQYSTNVTNAVINQVEEELEGTGNEIKWFETKILKSRYE